VLCLFAPLGRDFHTKTYNSPPPPIAAKLCALYLFFDRDRELQICITGTFFQWTINTGSYSSLSNRKGANLCRKCTEIRLAAAFRPDLLRERINSPMPPSLGELRTRSTQPCIPPGSLNRVPGFGWGKGGNVTSAGWQVTLCDPIRHVSSRSGVATMRTAIHLLLTYLLSCNELYTR